MHLFDLLAACLISCLFLMMVGSIKFSLLIEIINPFICWLCDVCAHCDTIFMGATTCKHTWGTSIQTVAELYTLNISGLVQGLSE